MEKKKQSSSLPKILLVAYTVLLLLCSGAVAAMPYINNIGNENPTLIVADGVLFWVGFAGAVITAIVLSVVCGKEGRQKGGLPGIICFFRSKEGIACDALAVVSLAAFIIGNFFDAGLELLFIFAAMFVFFFGMHSMLNGKNYIYIKSDRKERNTK